MAGKLQIPVKVAWSGKEKADMKFTPIGLVAGPKAAGLTIKSGTADGKLAVDFKGKVPTGTFTLPKLSLRYSIFPARNSATALPTSGVTVPLLGEGILPWGPRMRPSRPTWR